MKQFKPVLIVAIACVVIGAIVFAVMKLFPKEAETITPSETSSDMLMIVQKSATAVKEVNIESDDGEEFTILYSLDEKGNQTASIKDADPNLEYNTSDLYDLAGYIGIMAAIQKVENKKDADFGLDKPRRTIKVTFTDGEKITLKLGKDAPTGKGVYLKREDTKTTYLIGGSTSQMLLRTLRDYRVYKLFGPYQETSDIHKVTIERPGQDKLIVQSKTKNVETSQSATTSQYEILSPVQADAANDSIENKLLKGLIEIKSSALVEDNPKDLKKYGLDNPIRIELVDAEDKTVAFLVGAKAESGGNYVMIEGSNSVVVTEKEISFLNVDYTDIMLQLIFLHNMEDVKSVSYQLPGGAAHTLALNVSGKNISAQYDGGEITSQNASNLFLLTVRFTLQGKLDSSMKYGAPSITIKLTKKDGSTSTLALAQINERQYAAIIDGTARYYVNVTQINELTKAFETLKSGGTIPDMF